MRNFHVQSDHRLIRQLVNNLELRLLRGIGSWNDKDSQFIRATLYLGLSRVSEKEHGSEYLVCPTKLMAACLEFNRKDDYHKILHTIKSHTSPI